jgi:hypothetical protein
MARRFPRAVKKRTMWNQCHRAFDAMAADLRELGR